MSAMVTCDFPAHTLQQWMAHSHGMAKCTRTQCTISSSLGYIHGLWMCVLEAAVCMTGGEPHLLLQR